MGHLEIGMPMDDVTTMSILKCLRCLYQGVIPYSETWVGAIAAVFT